MANWKNRINVREDWQAAEASEITMAELARRMAVKLKALPAHSRDVELEEIIAQFEEIAEIPATSGDDFDVVLERLYDWADEDHRLWVGTV